MKVFYGDILHDLDALDRDLSLLVTTAEGSTDWNAIPNSILEIVKERVKMLESLQTELYSILEKYPL